MLRIFFFFFGDGTKDLSNATRTKGAGRNERTVTSSREEGADKSPERL